MNFQQIVDYLTTPQRVFIPFYDVPKYDNELPLNTHIRVKKSLSFWEGKMGVVIGYEQPPIGWTGWHWILFDGDKMPEHYFGLPKIHRDHIEVIE